MLYVLDEPSIGLHQRDNARLLETLKRLRDIGNTVLVVEHDEEAIRDADYLIDMGPGAGIHGGKVVAAGTPDEVMRNPASLTGAVPDRLQADPGAEAAARRVPASGCGSRARAPTTSRTSRSTSRSARSPA